MTIPAELKYTESHEWIKIEDNIALIGITHHAQSELGDIVYVELPDQDAEFETGQEFGTIEAVKTVADLFSPLSGKVIEVNEDLQDDAAVINEDPYGKGWIIKMEISDLGDQLISGEEYKAFIGK